MNETHENRRIEDLRKVFVAWPTPEGWIAIILAILMGIGGVVALTWRASAEFGSLCDRVATLEKDHQLIAETKKNTEDIKALLIDLDRTSK
jgi:hypothetical protein